MGKTQGGQILILTAEGGKIGNGVDQGLFDQLKCLLLDDQVGIADHELRSSTQMNNGFCLGALQAIGIDMGHHIMADLFFFGGCHLEINILGMCLSSSIISWVTIFRPSSC